GRSSGPDHTDTGDNHRAESAQDHQFSDHVRRADQSYPCRSVPDLHSNRQSVRRRLPGCGSSEREDHQWSDRLELRGLGTRHAELSESSGRGGSQVHPRHRHHESDGGRIVLGYLHMSDTRGKYPMRMASSNQRGIVLISSLLLLMIVTIFAITMFRSFGIQERIAGNTRDKERARGAAMTALQYAEWWITQNNFVNAGNCVTGLYNANASQGLVCLRSTGLNVMV